MFLKHTDSFAEFQTTQPAFRAHLCPGTLVETEGGWRAVEALKLTDRVATLDGGFAALASLTRREIQGPTWHVPVGALGNCTEMTLTTGQYVAISDAALLAIHDAPYVLMPIDAMAGFNGISSSTDSTGQTVIELAFDTEEILYANTGTLIHVPAIPNAEDPFFQRLGYGETRAALALMVKTFCAPDLAAA